MASSVILEDSLKDLFKSAPALPNGGKKFLVEWSPWLSLIAGIFSLLGAWNIWHWARVANQVADWANSFSAAYGGPAVATSRWTTTLWISLIIIIVQGILMVAAFSGLKARKKSGWNLLYYALLLNLAYGIVMAFTNYGGFSYLIGAVVGSAIGLYLLFQIRSSYLGGHKTADKADEAKS